MNKLIRSLGFFALAAALGGCWGGVYENPGAEYVRRTDTVTTSAGNAKEVNAAIHVTEPWPPYANNTRVPADGPRMVGAVQRYETQRGQAQPGQAGQPGTSTPPAPVGGMGGATPPATLPY
jgi:hypothetical protein